MRIGGIWTRQPANRRGILLILAGAFFFTMGDVTVKIIGHSLPAIEVTFFRCVIGLVILSPVFLRMRREDIKTKRPVIQILRVLSTGIAQVLVFIAIVEMMLADVTAITFSRPLFLTILAAIVLKEAVGLHRWGATMVGFAGVLVIMRPGQGGLDPAALIAVASAALFAISMILVRLLAYTDPPNRILFYDQVGGILFFLGPTIYVWRTPTWEQIPLVLALGVLTTLAVVCFIRAYSIAEASLLGPIDYVRLIFALAFGYFLAGEIPDGETFFGAAIIVASTLYIARRGARGGRPSG